MGQSRVNDPLAGLDEAWLQGVLARAGYDARDLRLLSTEPVGVGNTSEVARLRLGGALGLLPPTMIAKVPRLMPDGSTPPADLFGYDREVAAYRFFGRDPVFRIPRCFAGEQDAGTFSLLLEELGAGCRPGDQVAGCSIADADTVVAELTAMHARYWRSDEIDALDWANRRWLNAERTAGMFARGVAVMRLRYSDHLDETALALIEAADPLIRGWAATAPFAPTLIHADPRVDNVIFEADGRACLIDLQSISIGDAAFDLTYFLTGSLDPADREACEKRLVRAHAVAIRAVEPAYDDETAWRRYCQFALSGLIATVSAAGLLGERSHVPQIAALARRNCAAVAALDGIAGARDRIAEGQGIVQTTRI
jgi:aminoglycoside phosphotransferase (APT) family kinase protein